MTTPEARGEIWWQVLPKPNRFITQVAGSLLEERSVQLVLPQYVPWYQTMVDLIEDHLAEGTYDRSIRHIDSPEGDIGQYLFENECDDTAPRGKRRDQSYTELLAQCNDLTLNDKCIWVHNVNAEQFDVWRQFLSVYDKLHVKGNRRPLFILEMIGVQGRGAIKGLRRIEYSDEIDAYDRFVFSALISADTDIPAELNSYLAELASSVGRDDVELCGALSDAGKSFLKQPEDVLEGMAMRETRSDGKAFCMPNPEELAARQWESQLKILFPLIQRYTSDFVTRHESELQRCLPWNTGYETIDDPHDLELGHILRMIGAQAFPVNAQDYEWLEFLRRLRNRLAHMKPVGYKDVKTILMDSMPLS